MQKSLVSVLGSEYGVAIDNELNKLKPFERSLLGDVVAVVKRSDLKLGRTIHDDKDKIDESIYVIFDYTSLGFMCNRDIGTIVNKESNYKLISVNSFLEQVLEFNFTYLQLLFDNEPIYLTAKFYAMRSYVENKIHTSDEYRNLCVHKFVSTLLGILKDMHNGKFKDSVLRNRLFLAYMIVKITDKLLNKKMFTLNTETNNTEYTNVVINENISWLDSNIGRLSSTPENIAGAEISKDKRTEMKLNAKYEIIKNKFFADVLHEIVS